MNAIANRTNHQAFVSALFWGAGAKILLGLTGGSNQRGAIRFDSPIYLPATTCSTHVGVVGLVAAFARISEKLLARAVGRAAPTRAKQKNSLRSG